MIASYSWKLVSRNKLRSLASIFGLALATALLSGILFFIDIMAKGMTARALAPVTLDIAAHAARPDADTAAMAKAIAAQRGIGSAEAVIAADFSRAAGGRAGVESGMGRLFAVAPAYIDSFGPVRLSEGRLAPDGVVVSEAMAVSQKLALGDTVRLSFAGLDRPVELPVSGIANMERADALFSASNEAENALVSDVAFVDLGWFERVLLPPLARRAADPAAIPAPGSVILDRQVHVKIDRALLPADPARAAIQADALRRSVERLFPGDLKAVDNVAGALKAAKSDVLSAKLLFVFLGLPGMLLAAYLSTFAAELFAEARRRELSLLRTRGAGPRQVVGIVALSSLFLSLIGSALGVALGAGMVLLTGASGARDLVASASFLPTALASFAAGLALSFFASFAPSFSAMRREVLEDRKAVKRSTGQPFWKRAKLDLVCLAAAAVFLAVAYAAGGFKPTGNEGQAVQLSPSTSSSAPSSPGSA